MFGFNYYTPTKVIFGKGTESRVAELVREFGGKKILIHYGGGSVIRSGLLKRVTDTLNEAGIPYITLGGAGLAAVWGSWARYVCPECLPRFKRFALNVMGVDPSGTDAEIALRGIEALEAFFRRIGMPTNLRELGVAATDEDLALMAHKCAVGVGGAMGSASLLNEADMLAIYRASR